MHRNEVLRQAGNERQHTMSASLCPPSRRDSFFDRISARPVVAMQVANVPSRMYASAVVALLAKAAGQQLHNGLRALGRVQQRDTAGHAADDARDEHGQQHIQTGQAQNTEHQYGYRDRVCEQAEKNRHGWFSLETKTACSGTCTR